MIWQPFRTYGAIIISRQCLKWFNWQFSRFCNKVYNIICLISLRTECLFGDCERILSADGIRMDINSTIDTRYRK